MITLINSLYKINVISFIKITDKVYKLKCEDCYYILKYIDNSNIEIIIEKLLLLKINSFLFPILNINNDYISYYNNTPFIIYPYLAKDKASLNDLKLKFFLKELASLHNKTFYSLKINESFFKESYEYMGKRIDDMEEKIKLHMDKLKRKDYKSPSNWLFILNYPLYLQALDKANESLENYKKLSYSKKNIRMSFTYNNFDYNHIFLKESKIIGIENIIVSPPVYDIFYSLSTIKDLSIDIKTYYEEYFKSFIMDEYEKEWLYTMLYIPKIEFSDEEDININNITTSLNYLKNTLEILDSIKNISY